MDKEIIFLIIIFLFSLISNLLNKKKKRQQQRKANQSGNGDQTNKPRKRPFSFEDILKEFETEVLDRPEEKSIPTDDDNRPEYGKRLLEEYDGPRPIETKERYIDNAPTIDEVSSNYESYEGTSYETISESEIQMPEKLGVSKRDEHYRSRDEESNPYADILKSEDGLKKAIILNEILNRKY